MSRYKVVSDGTPGKTKLYDDTGRDVTQILKVTGISWEITTIDSRATITVTGLAIEAVGESDDKGRTGRKVERKKLRE